MLEEKLAEVIASYSDGPDSGIFTDGGASPNPGPGGWGVVHVEKGEVVQKLHGGEPDTTNNRMELRALINAYNIVDKAETKIIHSDSELCVNTITKWAAGWESKGWRRKSGPIKNLELVQELYALAKERPEVQLKWVRAHSGGTWNEYADVLANAWRWA